MRYPGREDVVALTNEWTKQRHSSSVYSLTAWTISTAPRVRTSWVARKYTEDRWCQIVQSIMDASMQMLLLLISYKQLTQIFEMFDIVKKRIWL